MCLGLPIGVLVFIVFWFCGIRLFPNLYIGAFLYGCVSSGTSYFLISLVSDFGLKIHHFYTDDVSAKDNNQTN
jgi:hypothetical protein